MLQFKSKAEEENMRKNIYLLTLSILLFCQQPTLANVGLEWYNTVWTTINNEYIDTTYNNQDWDKWKNKYYDTIKTEEDAIIAIDSMLNSLDDIYTIFFPPSNYEEVSTSLSGKTEGIGFYLSEHKKGFKIEEINPNSPAEKCGLKVGDIILSIDNNIIKDTDTNSAMELLSKEEGETVSLVIKRKKENDKTYNVKVEKYDINPVSLTPIAKRVKIPENIMYAKIDSFANKQSAQYFYDAYKKLPTVKGIIIDLRENSGGYVDRAATIANMFLKNKTIVTTIDRNNKIEEIKANEHLLTDAPIVVLINSGSASASEIFAATMKDNKRAKIVGTTSFGKGIVQRVDSLPNGAGLNFTVKKYLTPNGDNIHKKGVEPDYHVEMKLLDYILNKDSQLLFAIELLNNQ